MKKTIIIGFALALLLSGTTASAHENEGSKGNNKGNSDKHKTVVVDASATAQILHVKQQIAELNKQLAELKRTSHVGGKTVKSDDDNDQHGQNILKFCATFTKAHRHWMWGRNGHRWAWGHWQLDQKLPARCGGNATSTPPVVDTTAPLISAISVTNIGTTTTTVNWATSEAASSNR